MTEEERREPLRPLGRPRAAGRSGGAVGLGMPASLYLELFGSLVWDYFGTAPFLVGSALTGKNPRDVDVRLLLDAADYERFCGPRVLPERTNGKWAALCMAFSALGERLTGLPIDFQIQLKEAANATFDGPREALGMVAPRMIRAALP